jgi:hypothetical protein
LPLRGLSISSTVTDVPAQVNLEEAGPVGPIGLVFRMGKEDKGGLGVAFELTRALSKVKSGKALND